MHWTHSKTCKKNIQTRTSASRHTATSETSGAPSERTRRHYRPIKHTSRAYNPLSKKPMPDCTSRKSAKTCTGTTSQPKIIAPSSTAHFYTTPPKVKLALPAYLKKPDKPNSHCENTAPTSKTTATHRMPTQRKRASNSSPNTAQRPTATAHGSNSSPTCPASPTMHTRN